VTIAAVDTKRADQADTVHMAPAGQRRHDVDQGLQSVVAGPVDENHRTTRACRHTPGESSCELINRVDLDVATDRALGMGRQPHGNPIVALPGGMGRKFRRHGVVPARDE
jgi:hypothetical protein